MLHNVEAGLVPAFCVVGQDVSGRERETLPHSEYTPEGYGCARHDTVVDKDNLMSTHEHNHSDHSAHEHHGHHHGAPPSAQGRELTRNAVSATLHCLTGCAIGEVLGMVIGTALGWSNVATIALAVALAFVFGYALTIRPVLGAGVGFGQAVRIALAADTLSITVMEITDNAFILAIPGAMDAGLGSILFWSTLAAALAIAFVLTVPVNRWLIARGQGHAVVHQFH